MFGYGLYLEPITPADAIQPAAGFESKRNRWYFVYNNLDLYVRLWLLFPEDDSGLAK